MGHFLFCTFHCQLQRYSYKWSHHLLAIICSKVLLITSWSTPIFTDTLTNHKKSLILCQGHDPSLVSHLWILPVRNTTLRDWASFLAGEYFQPLSPWHSLINMVYLTLSLAGIHKSIDPDVNRIKNAVSVAHIFPVRSLAVILFVWPSANSQYLYIRLIIVQTRTINWTI